MEEDLKKDKYNSVEGAIKYREANKKVREVLKRTKQDYVNKQCQDQAKTKQQQTSLQTCENSDLCKAAKNFGHPK